MTTLIEPGDAVRAYDGDGNWIKATVIRVTPEWVRVGYELPFPYDKSQGVYPRDTLSRPYYRYYRLEIVRLCAWCEYDISGPAQAHPIFYARWGGPNDNWQCADELGCWIRQYMLYMEHHDRLTAEGSYVSPLTKGFLELPIGRLEAA